jgi:CSLREA domain-containing protein
MNRTAIFRAIALLLFSLGAATAGATTRTVISLGDSGAGTLRDTIAACGDGDTIVFAVTGQIKLTSGTLVVTHPITISGPGANMLEVTRTAGAFNIFKLQSSVTITDISITNGTAVGNDSSGGAIECFSGTLTLSFCTLSGNSAQVAGGAVAAASAKITGCAFNNNSAVEGGAIDFGTGPMTVSLCTFNGNHTSDNGGAITNFGPGVLAIDNSVFSQNTAPEGGAIFNFGFGGVAMSTTVRDSTFSGNGSTCQYGGAIAGQFGTLTLSNCTLVNNTSSAFGGGIYYDNGGVTLRNCTLANNSSATGGGIYSVGNGNNNVANVNVSCSTFSENSAPNGGGIYNDGTNGGNAFVVLSNSILFSSNSTPGANLINNGLGTTISSQGYNLSSDNGGGFLTATGDQINTDPKLGPLQDNGGPTATMALLAGSPAQDKGKNFGIGTDQRGLQRPTDITIPNASGGDGSDIGAVEMTGVPPFIVTTTADHNDGACNATDCTLREAIIAANANGGADTIIFGNGVTGIVTLQSALGTLTVTDSVTIIGPGADSLSVSGNSLLRPFRFAGGTSTISGLTIKGGNPPNNAGNTIGGGLVNQATLTINDCFFTTNTVHAASGVSGSNGLDGLGGAIHNSGTLALNRCTFSGNQAIGGDGGANTGLGHSGGTGGVGQGGAVYNATGAGLSMTNCTFSGNSAAGGAGGSNPDFAGGTGAIGSGGGVANAGSMSVYSTTLSGNQALGGNGGTGSSNINKGSPGLGHGGGLATIGGSSLIINTIAAGNTSNRGGGPDADGTFNSGGYNLIGIGDGSSGFTATADQVGSAGSPLNPQLGPLQDNGGPTNTMALLPNSPALDRGAGFGLPTDQRGLKRTVDLSNGGEPPPGDGTDIGAFEMQATTPTTLANVSTRLRVETGDNVLFGGFIVTGTQPKKVIVRALGPSVQAPGILANPTLELYQGNTLLETNDNWVDSPNKQAILDSTIPPPNNLESAIVRTLPANATSYTAIVRGVNNSTGIGVIEVYDLDGSVDSKLANISTRGLVQTGDNVLIAGTIVVGQASQKVLICALGPSIPVPGNLADPTLELRDASGTLLEANDNWVDSPNKQAIIDTGAAPPNNLESAIIHTLPANGALYTAIVRGANNGTGVAVVEVFALN